MLHGHLPQQRQQGSRVKGERVGWLHWGGVGLWALCFFGWGGESRLRLGIFPSKGIARSGKEASRIAIISFYNTFSTLPQKTPTLQ